VPTDLAPLLRPERSALVVFECLEGVIGPASPLPGLVAAVRETGLVGNVARLAEAARAAGVPVVYCTLAEQGAAADDGAETPLQRRLRDAGGRAPALGGVVEALAPRPGDRVVCRAGGVSGFHGGTLDGALREAGTRTVVLTGVSLNIGVLGTAIEAVNHGYAVVVPTDCVAGDPPEYGAQVLRHTLRHLVWLTRTADVVDRWTG
jgi:nicotinamidase-related amidase